MMRNLIFIAFITIPFLCSGQEFLRRDGSSFKRDGSFFKNYRTYAEPPEEPDPPEGTPRYVAVDGDNNNSGLHPDTAWATLTFAMSISSSTLPGDIIYVKAGDYGNEEVIFQISGTEANPITIQGYKTTPGDQPKDDWTYNDSHISSEMPYYENTTRANDNSRAFDFNEQEYIIVKNIQTTQYQYAAWIDGGHNKLENWFCTDMGDGDIDPDKEKPSSGIQLAGNKLPVNTELKGYDADSCILDNITIINSIGQGIWVYSDYDTVRNCEVYCNETGGGWATDYYIAISGQNNYIYNCYVHRVGNLLHPGHGIGVKGGWLLIQNDGDGDYFPEDEEDWTLCEGNVIRSCTARNMRLEAFWFGHPNVQNNTVDSCHTIQGRQSYVVRDGASYNTFSNCSADSITDGTRDAVIVFRDGSEVSTLDGLPFRENVFKNFLITNSWGAISFRYDGRTPAATVDTNYFYNFTCYNNDYFFADMMLENTDCVVTNAIISDCTNDYYDKTEDDDIIYSYSDFYNNGGGFAVPSGSNIITSNPLFNSAGTGDFTLQSGSPCRNTGTDVGTPYNGSNPDMGAFEYDE
jgi:hypothetical protein